MPNQLLPKRSVRGIRALSAIEELERLRLAARGAGEAAFDWMIAEDRIDWDGAVDILAAHGDPGRMGSGAGFREWMGAPARERIDALLSETNFDNRFFDLEFEAPSALGPAWMELRGVRIPGVGGKAERVAGFLRAVTERKRESQRLTYLATRDELTGHLNRTSLRSELARAIETAKSQQKNCTYLVTAIDRLAAINEAYGFGAADEVIVSVGERMVSALRSSDIIGRIAGNKFGVILESCSESEMTHVAERLRQAVRSEVISTRRGTVAATISVGAVRLPEDASSGQEAMLKAEEALDHARSAGRDSFHLYTQSPQREAARLRLMAIADELACALGAGRVVFAFQPIVCAKWRRPVHHECLLRIVRKDGSVATAGQFIPAAEQLGLIRQVDRRALELALAELHAYPDISLAVNVSGTTAGDPSWLGSFISCIRANQDVARRLVVELTETAALIDFEESSRFISGLRELGCKVAIDDFGAGFTSFRNLQMLRVDIVKIDGSFVRGLTVSRENQIFVRTLVELAKHFRLETVAEWVGSQDEAAMLESLGVDYFQGNYFGEPILEPPWKNEHADCA
ncbi:MAG TPA: bifunctional diguanylate cyclase/phosphodiesterase [Rhizomicrobium sp.]|nr:bifunctional diguanylate cyclase/phosphodiesterase [Rhizomicrobium sp.]